MSPPSIPTHAPLKPQDNQPKVTKNTGSDTVKESAKKNVSTEVIQVAAKKKLTISKDNTLLSPPRPTRSKPPPHDTVSPIQETNKRSVVDMKPPPATEPNGTVTKVPTVSRGIPHIANEIPLHGEESSAVVQELLLPHKHKETTTASEIDSDAPAPCSFEVEAHAIPALNIEHYHSVISVVRIMRDTSDLPDLTSTLVPILYSTIRSIVESTNEYLADAWADEVYKVAVISACEAILHERDRERIIELMDTIVSNLEIFFVKAERLSGKGKPLPDLPIEDSAGREVKPLSNPPAMGSESSRSTVGVVESSKSTSSNPIDVSSLPDRGEPIGGKQDADNRTAGKEGIVSRIMRKTNSSIASIRPIVPKPTVPPSAATVSSTSEVTTIPVYQVNESDYTFPDPLDPTKLVRLPPPSGEAVRITLNQRGEMRFASVSALVRLLTSNESIAEKDFEHTFLLCFRQFVTPLDLFDVLVDRYLEELPQALDDAQERVWKEEARKTKARVVSIFVMWLERYWRLEFDAIILLPLRSFVREKLKPRGSSATALAKALKRCDNFSDEYRCWNEYRGRQARLEKKVREISKTVPEFPSTGFDVSTRTLDWDPPLESFNTSSGRDELARQLTLMMSSLFKDVDPEDAVFFWKVEEDQDIKRKLAAIIRFEESITAWVIGSILSFKAAADRGRIMCFWLDIATVFLDLRNFSGANNILVGLINHNVWRLTTTIVEHVPIHHKRVYDHLNSFFSGSDLKEYYNAIRVNSMPAIPLLWTLKRNIVRENERFSRAKSKDDLKNGMIDISACRITSETVQILEISHVPYKFAKVHCIQQWIRRKLQPFTFGGQPTSTYSELTLRFGELSKSLESNEGYSSDVRDKPWVLKPPDTR